MGMSNQQSFRENEDMTGTNDRNQDKKVIVTVDSDLEDLIPGYFENRQKDIRSIRKALENDDYETIRILGHSMKGSGGGYGFDAITDIGRSLEEDANVGNADGIRKHTDELSSYLERVEVVYEEI